MLHDSALYIFTIDIDIDIPRKCNKTVNAVHHYKLNGYISCSVFGD